MSVYGFDLLLPDVKNLSAEIRHQIREEVGDDCMFIVTNDDKCKIAFSRSAKSRHDAVALAIHQVAKAGYQSFLEDIKPEKGSE